MAPRKKTGTKKSSSEGVKKADLTVIKGGTAVAETSKKSTAATKSEPKEESKAEAVKKASEEQVVEKKTEEKAAAKKPASRRGGSQKAEGLKTEAHIFEIDGAQINTVDIVERVKEAYKADGHQIGRIKKIDVYYNFEERRAYYVINDVSEGKFVEF